MGNIIGSRTDCKPRANNCLFRGEKGMSQGLLTRNFLYSMMTFLTDAPLAQLDRALDYYYIPTGRNARVIAVALREV